MILRANGQVKPRKNLRWYPVKSDPHGTFRGDGCEGLNQGVLDRIHEHALKVNARRRSK